MTISLPRHSQTLKNLTEHNHLIDVHELNRNTKVVGVDYKIPKMKFSWKNSLVSTLDLEDVFRSADLSRMTPNKFSISDMVQAVEMEVNEQGTEATAAMLVSGTRKFTPSVVPEIQFHVDRPFYVSIMHKPTHIRIFVGAVYNPQQ